MPLVGTIRLVGHRSTSDYAQGTGVLSITRTTSESADIDFCPWRRLRLFRRSPCCARESPARTDGRSDLADLRRLTPDNPLLAELKILTRDQDSLIQSQTRVVNQLTACLKAYYPTALTLFSKLQQACTLAFLRAFPTLQEARAASKAKIAAVLRAAGHPKAETKAQEIQEKLAHAALQARSEVTRAKTRLMLSLAGVLELQVRDLDAYDLEIARLFLSHPDSKVFASLPRAKTRIAPRLLAEWGDDRERYAGATSVQALAGTSPVVFESGRFSRVHRRYACSKPFRNALYQFAGQSIQKEAWAAAYYRRKREAGKSHSMALRALANQWVRIIHALWLKHEPYDPAVFLAAQQAHALRAA